MRCYKGLCVDMTDKLLGFSAEVIYAFCYKFLREVSDLFSFDSRLTYVVNALLITC